MLNFVANLQNPYSKSPEILEEKKHVSFNKGGLSPKLLTT